MADDNCAVCERTLRRRRRYVLSERLLETRRDFVEQLLRIVGGEVNIFLHIFFSLCLIVILM